MRTLPCPRTFPHAPTAPRPVAMGGIAVSLPALRHRDFTLLHRVLDAEWRRGRRARPTTIGERYRNGMRSHRFFSKKRAERARSEGPASRESHRTLTGS